MEFHMGFERCSPGNMSRNDCARNLNWIVMNHESVFVFQTIVLFTGVIEVCCRFHGLRGIQHYLKPNIESYYFFRWKLALWSIDNTTETIDPKNSFYKVGRKKPGNLSEEGVWLEELHDLTDLSSTDELETINISFTSHLATWATLGRPVTAFTWFWLIERKFTRSTTVSKCTMQSRWLWRLR